MKTEIKTNKEEINNLKEEIHLLKKEKCRCNGCDRIET